MSKEKISEEKMIILFPYVVAIQEKEEEDASIIKILHEYIEKEKLNKQKRKNS